MALVYYHFDPQGKSEDAKRATLITTTLLVVLFSILVCGALTKPLLQLLLEPQGTLAGNRSKEFVSACLCVHLGVLVGCFCCRTVGGGGPRGHGCATVPACLVAHCLVVWQLLM